MNRVIHFNIYADDPGRAVKFYGTVFGRSVLLEGAAFVFLVEVIPVVLHVRMRTADEQMFDLRLRVERGSFTVEANEKFQLKVAGDSSYLCLYI